MPASNSKIYRIFFWLIIASFFTLVIFFQAVYSPFVTAKALFFYFAVELTLPVYLYLCFKDYGFGHLKNPVIYAAGAFLVFSFVSAGLGIDFIHSVFSSFDRMQGVYFSVHMLLWLVYLMLLFRVEPWRVQTVLNVFIGIGAGSSLLGLLERLGVGNLIQENIDRSSALFGNPIFFAAFLILPFFFCWYQFDKSRKNFWYLGFGLIIFAGILSTKTAAADLALGIGLGAGALVYFFDRQQLKRWIAVVAVLIILAAASVFAVVKVPWLKVKFEGVDAQSRLIEWQTALRGGSEKPIFGVGPENYSYLANKYLDDRIYTYSDGFFDKPHNYFLEILDTTGIVGLIGYLLSLSVIGWGLSRLYRQQQLSKFGFAALAGGFAAYLTQNFFAFETISALMTLTALAAWASLAWEAELYPIKAEITYGVIACALVLVGWLMTLNLNITRASIDLGSALDYANSNPAVANSYFSKLTRLPEYADGPDIGTQYETFVSDLAGQLGGVNSNPDLINAATSLAIDYNQKIVDHNRYSLANQLSLARLYLLQSQLVGSLNPKVYAICNTINQIAPKRIEQDLILMVAYNIQSRTADMQGVMDDMLMKAPNVPAVVWAQVYFYALTGKARLVLDRTKQIISSSMDSDAAAQVDKLGNFYLNEDYFSQAEALYSEVLQAQPSQTYFYVQLARAYAESGDKETAARVIDTLKQKDLATYQKYQDQIDDFLKPAVLQVR